MVRLEIPQPRLCRLISRRINPLALSVSQEYCEETKNAAKDFIKDWTKEFEEAHDGRSPTQQEKEAIKGKFIEYKSSSKELKEASDALQAVARERDAAADAVAAVEAQLAGLGDAPRPPGLSPSSRSASMRLLPGSREEDVKAIEELEDQVYQLQEDLAAAAAAQAQLVAELAVKAAQYDEIVKEKRTDVVKRFEDEIAVLRSSEAALKEEVTSFKVRRRPRSSSPSPSPSPRSRTRTLTPLSPAAVPLSRSVADLLARPPRPRHHLVPTSPPPHPHLAPTSPLPRPGRPTSCAQTPSSPSCATARSVPKAS